MGISNITILVTSERRTWNILWLIDCRFVERYKRVRVHQVFLCGFFNWPLLKELSFFGLISWRFNSSSNRTSARTPSAWPRVSPRRHGTLAEHQQYLLVRVFFALLDEGDRLGAQPVGDLVGTQSDTKDVLMIAVLILGESERTNATFNPAWRGLTLTVVSPWRLLPEVCWWRSQHPPDSCCPAAWWCAGRSWARRQPSSHPRTRRCVLPPPSGTGTLSPTAARAIYPVHISDSEAEGVDGISVQLQHGRPRRRTKDRH